MAWLLLLLPVGCAPPPVVEPPPPHPLLRPAGSDTPVFSARLPELLALASVEMETDRIDFADLGDSGSLLDGWSLGAYKYLEDDGGDDICLQSLFFGVRPTP